MISPKIYKTVWGMFAGRCAICRETLIEKDGLSSKSLTGEVAHIIGQKKRAARGQHSLPLAKRDEVDNLLLLCRKHHKIVDDDRKTYSIDKLHEIRIDYLAWLNAKLQNPEPWTMKLSQLCYINVPRLCELAELQGYAVDLRH
jgi:predicted restriction endonuclease